MPDSGPSFEHERAIAELEKVILRAGNYIAPSDDLRPRTLEVAREVNCRQRTNHRVCKAVAVLLFLFVSGVPQSLVAPTDSSLFVHSEELHQRAKELTASAGVEPQWALYEVFRSLRDEQADRLNGSE